MFLRSLVEYRLGTKLLNSSINWERLKTASNYRVFLQLYLEERNLTYSTFARATGNHRGFPSDVILGRRRLSHQSSLKFEKALKIPPRGKKFFRALVALEEQDLFPEMNRSQLQELIQDLREKPWSSNHREVDESTQKVSSEILCEPQILSIIAAAGSPGRGANFSLIQKRTNIDEVRLKFLMDQLVDQKVLILNSKNSYEPQELHLFIKTSEQSQLLKSSFKKLSQVAHHRLASRKKNSNDFFFHSHFLVKKKQLPHLKSEMRALLLKYIDDQIEEDGDCVVQMLSALMTSTEE